MNKDIIYREDAIKAMRDTLVAAEIPYAVNALFKIPSADRSNGEWIDMGDFEKCSVCKATHLKEFQSYYGKVTWIKTPYCPNCGVKMRQTENEDEKL